MDRKNSTTFYGTSPLWADLTPIPLQDTSNADDDAHAPALATIAYSARYAEAMSYLRALMAAQEHSARALTLTADIIAMNPAHYTVWLYRSRTLRSLGDAAGPAGYRARVAAELAWLDDDGVCARNLKNYQVWHHRQTLVDALSAPPPGEMEFITAILALDAKNYHVWTYRQWLCARFAEVGGSEAEMKRVEVMIEEDVRNNSAWSHRFFLCFGIGGLEGSNKDGGGGVVDEEVVEREVDYAMGKIELAPQNASPWNYLKGVLKKGGRGLESMQSFCEEFVGGDLLGDGVRSSHAVDWLAEIYQKQGEQRRAEECLDALSKKWDPIRANYWEYRKKQMVPVA